MFRILKSLTRMTRRGKKYSVILVEGDRDIPPAKYKSKLVKISSKPEKGHALAIGK